MIENLIPVAIGGMMGTIVIGKLKWLRRPHSLPKIHISRGQLMGIAVVISLLVGVANFTGINAAFRQQFPASNSFSVVAAYSFADGQQASVLYGGNNVTVHLTINNASPATSTIKLSFQADPQHTDMWSFPSVCGMTPDQQQGTCSPAFPSTYTMTIAGTQIVPENDTARPYTDPFNGQNVVTFYANDHTALVTVAPGANTYIGTLVVDGGASPDSFSIVWFASK